MSNTKSLYSTANIISNVGTDYIATKIYADDFNRGGVCFGDSGGALLGFIDDEWKAIGISSIVTDDNCGFDSGKADSLWLNTSSINAQQFIKDNTEGVLD